MLLLKNGKTLLSVLALALSGCRNSTPPPIDICIGDGFGGGDCVLKDGSKAYRSPSELKDAWITTQFDMQAFATWCYDAPPAMVQSAMQARMAASRR